MKFLFFDFDGVIVDSFRICYECMLEFEPDLSEEVYRGYFNGNIYESDAIDEDDYDPASDSFFDSYTPRILAAEPVAGMSHVLAKLAKGRTLAVVSSTINAPIRKYLHKHGLDAHFKKIYGADVHMSKHVKIRMALSDFNVQPRDCLFITDTLGDMREAAREHVRSIGVSWGFQHRDILQQGDPLAIVDTPEELLKKIEEF